MKLNQHVTNDIIFRLYNVMIDGQSLFDKTVRNNLITYDSIQNISTGQGDDYTTGCSLDYN